MCQLDKDGRADNIPFFFFTFVVHFLRVLVAASATATASFAPEASVLLRFVLPGRERCAKGTKEGV